MSTGTRTCMLVCSVVSDSLQPMGCMQPSRLLCPWNFPGKNTGVDCHFLLQGIFPTQGSNPHLLHLLLWLLYHQCHLGSPYLSIITLNVNGVNVLIKRWSVCMNFFKKMKLYLHEIHFNLKGTHRLKVKGSKKRFSKQMAIKSKQECYTYN